MAVSDVSADLRVPCEVLSVAVVRRRLATQMLEAGCSEQFVNDSALVLSELLMNAIVHGVPDDDGQVGTAWSFDGEHLDLTVTDSGDSGVPHVESPAIGEGGGRGLHLVDRLSESWSTDRDTGRTRVRASLSARRIRAVPRD